MSRTKLVETTEKLTFNMLDPKLLEDAAMVLEDHVNQRNMKAMIRCLRIKATRERKMWSRLKS